MVFFLLDIIFENVFSFGFWKLKVCIIMYNFLCSHQTNPQSKNNWIHQYPFDLDYIPALSGHERIIRTVYWTKELFLSAVTLDGKGIKLILETESKMQLNSNPRRKISKSLGPMVYFADPTMTHDRVHILLSSDTQEIDVLSKNRKFKQVLHIHVDVEHVDGEVNVKEFRTQEHHYVSLLGRAFEPGAAIFKQDDHNVGFMGGAGDYCHDSTSLQLHHGVWSSKKRKSYWQHSYGTSLMCQSCEVCHDNVTGNIWICGINGRNEEIVLWQGEYQEQDEQYKIKHVKTFTSNCIGNINYLEIQGLFLGARDSPLIVIFGTKSSYRIVKHVMGIDLQNDRILCIGSHFEHQPSSCCVVRISPYHELWRMNCCDKLTFDLAICDWNQARLMWVGHLKNKNNKKCLVRLLPKDVIKYILQFAVMKGKFIE